MVFSSTLFLLLFLPAILVLYYGMPKRWRGIGYRNNLLLIASLIFYAYGEPIFVFVMLFFIVLNWFVGLKIEKSSEKSRKKWLIFIIFLDILLIFIFKYISFVFQNIGLLIGHDFEVNIALPIGISFFTFQIMSYVFDIYYGKVHAEKNILKVALYISLFPQLIAGPIVQYNTVQKEINNRTESKKDFAEGLFRFVFGLGKKVMISNFVAIIADNAFAVAPEKLSVASAWLGAIAYTLQIYFDFSGYSDMAIGLGKMFGFHFNENFNYPYAATSVTDFWRRWHISLSSWFRDYVYIPLGGNRRSKGRVILNLATVWLLTGIWHGANWTFIIWGIYYFVLLLIERQLNLSKKTLKTPFAILYRVVTLCFVIIGWVIFRSENIGTAFTYLGVMFGRGVAFVDSTFTYTLMNGWTVLLVAILLSFPVFSHLKQRLQRGIFHSSKKNNICCYTVEIVRYVSVLVIFVLSICLVVQSTYNPFIYFNF